MIRLLMFALLMLSLFSVNAIADKNRGRVHDHNGIVEQPLALEEPYQLPENSERMLPMEGFTFWGTEQLPDAEEIDDEKVFPKPERVSVDTSLVTFTSGYSLVDTQPAEELKNVIQRLKGKKNLRLSFIGHTDNEKLSARSRAIYGDNLGLSRSRAEKAAKYFQKILELDDNAVYWEGKGDTDPIASNSTEAGRRKNRRVEIEVWYDVPKHLEPDTTVMRTSVCHVQPMCRVAVTDKEGKSRIRIDNVIEPIRIIKPIEFEFAESDIPSVAIQNILETVDGLKNHTNFQLVFVGYTDNTPVTQEPSLSLYGNNIGLSEARAKEVANFFKKELNLSDDQVFAIGRGAADPIASNDNSRGRALNRRVELQIYYDKREARVIEEENPELAADFKPEIQWCHLLSDEQRANASVERVGVVTDPRDAYELSPFRITVDGQPLNGFDGTHTADGQRCTDVALEKAQVQVQYDNLLLKPRLAISAWPSVVAYEDDISTGVVENITHFSAYSNYPAYIEKAEVRLFLPGQSIQSEPILILPMDKDFKTTWQVNKSAITPDATADTPRKLTYLVRVYSNDGRFDETKAQELWLRPEISLDIAKTNSETEKLISYGENSLALQNILFDSGTITVNGIDVPPGHKVYALGHQVPVSADGKFVAQYIIPEGLHTVEVSILDEQGNGQLFHRDLQLKNSDWFYVGIADLTFGMRDTDGPASTITQDDTYDDDSYIDGRLAFYTKGKTHSNWEITASADTKEEPIEDLFKDFDDKDPMMLFRRFDSDDYYPTFADDSSIEEDAPTQGKLYFKAQKGKSYGMWGNFETKLLDTDLAQIDRALYGAQIHYESKGLTKYGEQRTNIDLFAADPGTQSAREEYLGTGGSLYFLKHQDITIGSERVRIEVRDKDTGLVVANKSLSPGQDYDIDPIQGRIMLNAPLSATGASDVLVRDGSISGNENYLIVTYEFTPGFDELDEVATGGRASQWLGNHVEVGVTASEQQVNDIDQTLKAVDVTLRANPSNYIKIEAGQTEGLSNEQRDSIDGGFSFNDTQPQGTLAPEQEANAQRIETGFSLGRKGRAKLFAQQREAGYSAPGQLTTTDTAQYGAQANYSITQDVSVNAKYSEKDEEIGEQNKSIDAGVAIDLSERWKLDLGARRDEKQNNKSATANDTGERTDAAVEIGYNSLGKWTAYGLAQGTIEKDETRAENNRAGVGGSYQVYDRLKLDAEVSGGDTGTGAKLGSEYQATDRTQFYVGYALENQRNDTGLRARRGNITGGFKSRYTDTVSIYGEERYAYGDQPVGLTHAYGVDLAPTDAWNFGASVEAGNLKNPNGNNIKRLALGFNVGYSWEKTKYAGAIEYRKDDAGSNDRVTWLLKNKLTYQNTDDWRTIGKFNWSKSKSSQGEFFDGDFTEFVWGYGYRPVFNDRLNALLKYTFFFNKPAPEQVSTSNVNSQFIQRSHVFSGDISYDLTKRWTLGGKYAYRLGELAVDREKPDYFQSRAHLGVLRLDWHVVKHWDLLLEGRVLELTDAQDRRSGFLVGVYRHFGQHLKVGLGYNFTDFSDDLTDLSYDSQGIFVNVVGKF